MSEKGTFEWRGKLRSDAASEQNRQPEFEWRGVTRNSNAPIPSQSPLERHVDNIEGETQPRSEDWCFGNNGTGSRKAHDVKIGQRFGDLVVTGPAPSANTKSQRSGGRFVFVKCDCGTEVRVRLSELRYGHRTGCGQRSHWDKKATEAGEQIMGQRFGVLTVVAASASRAVTPGGSRAAQVLVRCDCGAERWARVTDLRGGSLKSCGGDAHKTLKPSMPKRWEVHGKRQTYALEAAGTGLVKIGSSRDFKGRLWKMQPMSAVDLRIFAFSPDDIERKLHITLAAHRMHGEWFAANDEVMSVIESSMRPMQLSVLDEFKTCRPGLAKRGKHQCKRCGELGHHAKTCSRPLNDNS